LGKRYTTPEIYFHLFFYILNLFPRYIAYYTHTFSTSVNYVFHASLFCVLLNRLNLMLQEAEQSAEEERGHQAQQGRKERQEEEEEKEDTRVQ
jgi:hypothetical protein